MASHYDSNEKLPGIDTLPNLNLNEPGKRELVMPSTTYLPPPSHSMPCPTYSQNTMNPLYQSNMSPPLTPAVSPSSMILSSEQFKRKYSVDVGPFGFGTSLPESIQDQDAFRRSSCSAMSVNGCAGESHADNYDQVDSRGQEYTQFFGSNLQNTSFYTSSPLSENSESDNSSSQSGKRGSRTTPPVAQHKHSCKYPFCNWSFKRYEHLKRHMLVHTGKKPHVCHFPGCGKSFSRSDNFNAHYRTHTKKSKFNQIDVQSNQPHQTSQPSQPHQPHQPTQHSDAHLPHHQHQQHQSHQHHQHYQHHQHHQHHQHQQPHQSNYHSQPNQPNQNFDNQYLTRPSFDINYQEIYRTNYTQEENHDYHSQNQYLRNFNIPPYNSEAPMLQETTTTFMNDRAYPIVYQSDSQLKKTNQKSHVCPISQCQRSFKRLEHLKRHMRIHTLERPFACSFPGCQKTFSRSDNLSQHMKTHQRVEDRRRKQKRNSLINWTS